MEWLALTAAQKGRQGIIPPFADAALLSGKATSPVFVARVSFRLLFFGVSGQSQASPVAIDLPSGFRRDLHEIRGGFPEALVEGVCEKGPSSRQQICVDSFQKRLHPRD